MAQYSIFRKWDGKWSCWSSNKKGSSHREVLENCMRDNEAYFSPGVTVLVAKNNSNSVIEYELRIPKRPDVEIVQTTRQ